MIFAVGFLWALMESLWFFIVPDVALSYLALKGWRAALKSTTGAVVGALVGCVLLYLVRASAPPLFEQLRLFWTHLPGYYPNMFQVVDAHLQADGARGLIAGPTSGIPYRYYIHQALQLDLPLLNLLAWTPVARLERIVIAPVVVLALRFFLIQITQRWAPQLKKYVLPGLVVVISLYWVGLYIWYWGTFLPQTYGLNP